MIINHRKPSLNQGIFRPSPSPSPFNSHILVLIALIVYFAHLVQILSRQQISLPTKYNTPSRNQDTTFTRNIRFLILLQVLLLLQRAIILKNTIPLLLYPHPSLSTFSIILRTYSNTITTPISQSQCHSLSPAPVLPLPLALIMT